MKDRREKKEKLILKNHGGKVKPQDIKIRFLISPELTPIKKAAFIF